MEKSRGVEFNCAICGKPAKSALLRVGAFCSEPCKKQLMKQDEERKAELLAEPVNMMPDEFDLPAFERYILKVALHMIRDLTPVQRAKWAKKTPMLLVADELSMAIKEKVIPYIALDYISAMEATGHERMFHGGTYQFKKKVPKEKILEALIQGHVFKRPPESDE